MLTPETRYENCENFRKRISSIFSDIEDALTFTYKPYGKVPDEDTPFFEKLFNEFERLNDAITTHSEKLFAQWSEWEGGASN